MTTIPVLGDEAAGPWFRVISLTAPRPAGPAEQDFVSILPAALAAAGRGRPLVAGWLCRGAGSPLELITNAAASEPDPPPAPFSPPSPGAPPSPSTLPPPGPPSGPGTPPSLSAPPSLGAHPSLLPARPRTGAALAAGQALLYPPGSRGVLARPGWLEAWDSLVWVLCPGRQAPPLADATTPQPPSEPVRPTLFESALAALIGRPFGWLVVAEPTSLLDAEIAGLRTEVNVLRRHDEEQSRFGAERTGRRLAELDAFREGGLWRVRVLAGAAFPAASSG